MQMVNETTKEGYVSGGFVKGTGIEITWQSGPRGTGEQDASGKEILAEPNGAFVEDVIFAAKQRLEAFQKTDFMCRENALAITKLEEAIHWLQHRAYDREQKGTLGKHEV